MNSTQGNDKDTEPQVHDQGTRPVPADEVANAAAESLHGTKAVEETHEQPDARELRSGTLISDE